MTLIQPAHQPTIKQKPKSGLSLVNTQMRIIKLLHERPYSAAELAPLVGVSRRTMCRLLRNVTNLGYEIIRIGGLYKISISTDTMQLKDAVLVRYNLYARLLTNPIRRQALLWNGKEYICTGNVSPQTFMDSYNDLYGSSFTLSSLQEYVSQNGHYIVNANDELIPLALFARSYDRKQLLWSQDAAYYQSMFHELPKYEWRMRLHKPDWDMVLGNISITPTEYIIIEP